MSIKELIVALPTDDRAKAFEFYKSLGFKLARNPESNELPEPLELRLTSNTVLMLVPRDGFAFVTHGNQVAANGVSEVMQTFMVDEKATVDDMIAKAKKAGATIVIEPSQQFMGYAGQFKDLDGHLWMVVNQ
ncbi:MAG TPA: VOC family protein [Candidatus Saccharimonadales bacterium]|nr:VOC family protein [Candidatus Saccharimonadales bacterium]